MKLTLGNMVGDYTVTLKPKEPRLRDWNSDIRNTLKFIRTLKPKEPRLRDWNSNRKPYQPTLRTAWNQKNLDYEIETKQAFLQSECVYHLKPKEPRLRDWNNTVWSRTIRIEFSWNQKNLDYEIETPPQARARYRRGDLKPKEPRLRDWNPPAPYKSVSDPQGLKPKEPRLRDWNRNRLQGLDTETVSWNQKNLDYEIETIQYHHWHTQSVCHLKPKEPRLRDWN